MKKRQFVNLLTGMLLSACLLSCKDDNIPSPNGSQNNNEILSNKDSEKRIITFTFSALTPQITASINESEKIITLWVPKETDVSALTPTIKISEKATISPKTGVTANFTRPVVYTVTAENGSTQAYTVNVYKFSKDYPTITSISPEIGARGAILAITGANFGNTIPIVVLDDILATIIEASPTTILIKVPSQARSKKNPVKVIIADDNGGSATATSPVDFEVINKPVIKSFSPAQGAPGTVVTIKGFYFYSSKGETHVVVNKRTARVISVTNDEIVCEIPAQAGLRGKIEVNTNYPDPLYREESVEDFLIERPVISDFPKVVHINDEIIITGNYFSTLHKSDNKVKINGIEATVLSFTATQLKIKVPSGATSGRIEVEVDGLKTTSVDEITIE
jgi:hypothetical protein